MASEKKSIPNLILGWLAIALTAVLLMCFKYLHLGVIHYNIFLLILIGWGVTLVVGFRWLGAGERKRLKG